jgi:hypothetical protein
MKKPFKVIDLYKAVGIGESLLPTGTGFDFWEETYEANTAVYDREFARRYTSFEYFDFMEADTIAEARENFHADVLSILTFNKKRYEEMYRVFLVEDEDDPITYNYDMVETTGAQHTESTKGSQENTTGQQINTVGQYTDTTSTNVADASTLKVASQDQTSEHTDTLGQRIDTEGQRKDEYDSDEWTLTRRGNIGVQTAADILNLHTRYWTETYKFFNLIFDDIAKQLLMVGD